MPAQRPVLNTFLALTQTPSKESPPSSRAPSLRTSSGDPLPSTSLREHRGSTSSVSSTNSDIGENGFLILTPVDTGFEDNGLKKIEEEAIE